MVADRPRPSPCWACAGSSVLGFVPQSVRGIDHGRTRVAPIADRLTRLKAQQPASCSVSRDTTNETVLLVRNVSVNFCDVFRAALVYFFYTYVITSLVVSPVRSVSRRAPLQKQDRWSGRS